MSPSGRAAQTRAARAFLVRARACPRAGQAGDQPRAALEGDVAPGPVQRDDRSAGESRSGSRCGRRSTAPRRRSPTAAPCRSRPPRACGRWWRASRNRGSGTAAASCRCARAIRSFARYSPCCLATGATPGSGLPSASSASAVSPITKTSGWSGTDRSGATLTRPARSAGTPSQLAAGDAFTPAAHMIVRVSMRSLADRHVFDRCRPSPSH